MKSWKKSFITSADLSKAVLVLVAVKGPKNLSCQKILSEKC